MADVLQPSPAKLSVGSLGSVDIVVTQFVGLLRIAEYNAYAAKATTSDWLRTAYSVNTLLSVYAALEALILETTFLRFTELYSSARFRKLGIMEKFEAFLDTEGGGRSSPAVVAEIAALRIALTHSEPDNVRTRTSGAAFDPDSATRFAKSVRSTATWLWETGRPSLVANEFDDPNPLLEAANAGQGR